MALACGKDFVALLKELLQVKDARLGYEVLQVLGPLVKADDENDREIIQTGKKVCGGFFWWGRTGWGLHYN